jgi:hypothetical protein
MHNLLTKVSEDLSTRYTLSRISVVDPSKRHHFSPTVQKSFAFHARNPRSVASVIWSVIKNP